VKFLGKRETDAGSAACDEDRVAGGLHGRVPLYLNS
jgi:hypothetical protein